MASDRRFKGYSLALLATVAGSTVYLSSKTALFVLIGAFLIFGKFPLEYQLVAGALTIAGPMWLILGKSAFSHRK